MTPAASAPERAVVLAGAGGILGRAFAALIPPASRIDLGREQLDPADPAATAARIAAACPALVINCAADTDVEGAEAAPEHAFAVNATLAGAIARGAAEAGSAMVHFSSTGCYGAWKDGPYTEDDPLRPTTAHHRSKAAGEEAVLAAHPGGLVLRVGWLFGGRRGQPKNFVWGRIQEARGKAEIRANPAQRGNPTSAEDVAAQTLRLVQAGVSGVANCVGGGGAPSRLQYVAAILSAAGSPARVVPAVFARRAPVSANETALNARLAALGLDGMPPWRQSLVSFVRRLLAPPAGKGAP